MTARSLIRLTREDSHYVVRYISDSTIQLRQRSYIKADGVIVQGQTYPTQWGSARDVEDAVILHAGDYNEMRHRESEEKSKAEEADQAGSTSSDDEWSPLASPRSPTPPHSPTEPPAKRQRKEDATRKTVVAKNLASVISRVNSATPRPDPTPNVFTFTGSPEADLPVFSPVIRRPEVPSPAPLTTASSPRTPTATPLTPLANTPTLPSNRTPIVTDRKSAQQLRLLGEVHRQNVVILRRLDALESAVNQILGFVQKQAVQQPQCIELPNGTIEDINSIPDEYRIDEECLRGIRSRSFGAGNFAKRLTERLFPELFGVDSLRLRYTWFGGGVHNKQPLDQIRKDVIKTYVTHFYPEVASVEQWKDIVVPKVNEGLRRPVDRVRKSRAKIQIPRQRPIPEVTTVEEDGRIYTRL